MSVDPVTYQHHFLLAGMSQSRLKGNTKTLTYLPARFQRIRESEDPPTNLDSEHGQVSANDCKPQNQ